MSRKEKRLSPVSELTPREKVIAAAASPQVFSRERFEAALDQYRNSLYEMVAESVELAMTLAVGLSGAGPERDAVEGAYGDIVEVVRGLKHPGGGA